MTEFQPYRIFAFWTGDNPMSENRKACLATFERTGLEPVLVTPDNLSEWVVPDHPIHPAYEHLSAVHRSDYLRAYFMHHYGGGYSDIKTHKESWINAVNHTLNSHHVSATGYKEISGGTAALERQFIDGTYHIHSFRVPFIAASLMSNTMNLFHFLMIGNCAFYFKPNSRITRSWLTEVERRLSLLYNSLRHNPAQHPRDKHEDGNGYPVPWSFILGSITGPLFIRYFSRISRKLPMPDFSRDYM